ncbi:hypothetical protein ABZ570_27910 [Micromonospora sp. NPDC007271]|uniref:hypothetical protein n=1 Tax=Micromonospora sp. NPDC007271 TaxID=3154587 RepID=UPI0033E72B81
MSRSVAPWPVTRPAGPEVGWPKDAAVNALRSADSAVRWNFAQDQAERAREVGMREDRLRSAMRWGFLLLLAASVSRYVAYHGGAATVGVLALAGVLVATYAVNELGRFAAVHAAVERKLIRW